MVYSFKMITTSFYLDTRATKPGSPAPLKLSVTKNGSTSYIPIGVSLLPAQWDKTAKRVIGHPRKSFLNTYLQQKKLDIDEVVLSMMKRGGYASLSVTQIKKEILASLNPEEEPKETFLSRLQKYADESNPRTRQIYLATMRRMEAYQSNASKLTFEDVTEEWLHGFDEFLKKSSPALNARSIHFRNIRAVFNDAHRNGVTTNYPFDNGRFEIRTEPTRKRSLKLDILRKVFSADVEDWQEKYRDMFKLTFLLIGINFVDLYNLTSIEDGRIEYRRAKTSRQYSIKVEPEALALIQKHAGSKNLLYLADHSDNYRISYMQLCRGLKSIREALGIPELSTYWARHSWATVASSLGVPKDTIAQALGHDCAGSRAWRKSVNFRCYFKIVDKIRGKYFVLPCKGGNFAVEKNNNPITYGGIIEFSRKSSSNGSFFIHNSHCSIGIPCMVGSEDVA